MKINLDKCANCMAIGLVTLLLFIAAALYSYNVFADDPHHDIPEPVINITEVTEVTNITTTDIADYSQVVDHDRLNDLGNALTAVSAISGLQSITLPNGGIGGSMSISKYDSYGGAFSLQHRYDDVNYSLNYGNSNGEGIVTISAGGRFR